MTPSFRYAEPPDVPEGMTLDEYRRRHATAPRRGLLARLRRRSAGARTSLSRAARSRLR